ncbi:MAG: hypothetical protein RLZZ08_1341 [Pseudomonadota bacterium]|jgi:uncharacterized Zn-finger protein
MEHAPDTAPETTLVDEPRTWCDGAGSIRGGSGFRPAALGHPRVYLQIDETGYADCGYCDRRFVLKGGPAHRGLAEMSAGALPEANATVAGSIEP